MRHHWYYYFGVHLHLSVLTGTRYSTFYQSCPSLQVLLLFLPVCRHLPLLGHQGNYIFQRPLFVPDRFIILRWLFIPLVVRSWLLLLKLFSLSPPFSQLRFRVWSSCCLWRLSRELRCSQNLNLALPYGQSKLCHHFPLPVLCFWANPWLLQEVEAKVATFLVSCHLS